MINHKGTKMVKDREDWHGLQRTKLNNLGYAFQVAQIVTWLHYCSLLFTSKGLTKKGKCFVSKHCLILTHSLILLDVWNSLARSVQHHMLFCHQTILIWQFWWPSISHLDIACVAWWFGFSGFGGNERRSREDRVCVAGNPRLYLSQAPRGFGVCYRSFLAFLARSTYLKTAKLRRLIWTGHNFHIGWLWLNFLSSLICLQNFGLDEEKFRKEFCGECPELFYRIAFLCCDLDSDKRCTWMSLYCLCILTLNWSSPRKLFLT